MTLGRAQRGEQHAAKAVTVRPKDLRAGATLVAHDPATGDRNVL